MRQKVEVARVAKVALCVTVPLDYTITVIFEICFAFIFILQMFRIKFLGSGVVILWFDYDYVVLVVKIECSHTKAVA